MPENAAFDALIPLIQPVIRHPLLACFELVDDFARSKMTLSKLLRKLIVKTALKIERLENKYKECLNWYTFYHEGILLQSHLFLWKKGLPFLEVTDWEDDNKAKKIALSAKLTGEEEV